MKQCVKCGTEMREHEIICKNCGYTFPLPSQSHSNSGVNPNDGPDGVFVFLGFIIPLFGFILYCIFSSKSPEKARSAVKGAIAGMITAIVLPVLLFSCDILL